MTPHAPIVAASIDWSIDNVPRNNLFGDIYFARESGANESQHVFIHGNNLPERWQHSQQFTVFETGFGTGLNFFVSCQQWLISKSSHAKLYYIAVEKHPVPPNDIARIGEHWPELKPFVDRLLAIYPPFTPGLHLLRFDDIGVTLQLYFGDVYEGVNASCGTVDAWYLDGFAPTRNPLMWVNELFGAMANRSKPGATLATFTVAGAVRRGLESHGFQLTKAAGFGNKREMLTGVYAGTCPTQCTSLPPWYKLPPPPTPKLKQAVIIGGGFAGVTSAIRLADDGWQVTIIDRNAQFGSQGSGNAYAVTHPYINAQADAVSRFWTSALRFAATQLSSQPEATTRTGVCVMARGVADIKRQQSALSWLGVSHGIACAADSAMASDKLGIGVNDHAAWFPDAHMVNMPLWIAHTLQHYTSIRQLCGAAVAQLQFLDDVWHILDAHNKVLAAADVVIIATAAEAITLLPAIPALTIPTAGQISLAPATIESSRLRAVISYDGFITPERGGLHAVGASFRPGSLDVAPQASDDADNLTRLQEAVPSLAASLGTPTKSWTGIRATTNDHLPVIGPLPDFAFYRSNYHDLRHGRPAARYPDAAYHPGLYLNIGHGARGLVSCFIAAELIAAHASGAPLPIEREMLSHLHPARFLIRDLRRSTQN